MGQATTALVRALLTTAAQAQCGDEALDDALGTRIALHVDAHLADRDLTVDGIAAAHNISVRHLYNVWARAGHQSDARRSGSSSGGCSGRASCWPPPTPGRTTIAAVARRCGFADSSHFSRRFRESFGTSPREWREAQHRAPQLVRSTTNWNRPSTKYVRLWATAVPRRLKCTWSSST